MPRTSRPAPAPQTGENGAAPATARGPLLPVEPLALGAAAAAAAIGVSRRHWLALADSGRAPAGLRLGRRRLWPAEELRAWVAAGCPPRARWDALRQAPEVRS